MDARGAPILHLAMTQVYLCHCLIGLVISRAPSLNRITIEKRGRVMDSVRVPFLNNSEFQENHKSFFWQDQGNFFDARNNDFMSSEKDQHLDLQILRICSGTMKEDCRSKSNLSVAFQLKCQLFGPNIKFGILW